MYTDVIKFMYNFQPNESTEIAPFDLVISRPPGTISEEVRQPEPSSATNYKWKWKAWLAKASTETKRRLSKAQERYKRNFDRRLRRNNEHIKSGDHVFLRRESRDDSETGHKSSPIATGR